MFYAASRQVCLLCLWWSQTSGSFDSWKPPRRCRRQHGPCGAWMWSWWIGILDTIGRSLGLDGFLIVSESAQRYPNCTEGPERCQTRPWCRMGLRQSSGWQKWGRRRPQLSDHLRDARGRIATQRPVRLCSARLLYHWPPPSLALSPSLQLVDHLRNWHAPLFLCRGCLRR